MAQLVNDRHGIASSQEEDNQDFSYILNKESAVWKYSPFCQENVWTKLTWNVSNTEINIAGYFRLKLANLLLLACAISVSLFQQCYIYRYCVDDTQPDIVY